MNWFEQVWSRVVPEQGIALAGPPIVVVLVVALVAVAVDPVWRVVRLGVTLVHELGHAGVGMLSGRRFTGFVLRGDMSGHAVLVTAALRVRSGLTAAVVGVALVGAGALWWTGSPQLQAQAVVAVGIVLIVGAWRHLGAVIASSDRAVSDPGVLARLTRVPRAAWNTTFVAALAGATWIAGTTVLEASGALR